MNGVSLFVCRLPPETLPCIYTYISSCIFLKISCLLTPCCNASLGFVLLLALSYKAYPMCQSQGHTSVGEVVAVKVGKAATSHVGPIPLECHGHLP